MEYKFGFVISWRSNLLNERDGVLNRVAILVSPNNQTDGNASDPLHESGIGPFATHELLSTDSSEYGLYSLAIINKAYRGKSVLVQVWSPTTCAVPLSLPTGYRWIPLPQRDGAIFRYSYTVQTSIPMACFTILAQLTVPNRIPILTARTVCWPRGVQRTQALQTNV